MIIELATKQYIDTWMALVGKVKDSFPGLETEITSRVKIERRQKRK